MAATGTITLTGKITGAQWGDKVIGGSAGLTLASGGSEVNVAAITTIVLAAGDNVITVPSTACTAAIIVFGPASTQAKKLTPTAGVAGVPVTKTGWVVLPFDAAGAPASFVINCAANDTGSVTEINFI